MSINKQSRNADTRDLRKMDLETENVYLTTVVISRRADQIAEKQKEELRNRLEPFANDGDNLEEIQENPFQITSIDTVSAEDDDEIFYHALDNLDELLAQRNNQ